jgi:tetratricopeptide (TPR) repeat protein
MRKAFLLSMLSFSLTSALIAQENTLKPAYLEIYRHAIRYNDLNTAAYALTGLLLQGDNESFRDTLSLVYYNMNNFPGAYKLAGEINEKNPENITALTLLADITGKAGEVKTSLEWYEKLCKLNANPYNHYQLASKQFILERNLECKQSLKKILEDTANANQIKVRLEIGEGYGEDVTVMAAALNMMGAVAYREKDIKGAEEWYRKAVQSFPDFVIAKQNLEELLKPVAKPETKKPGAPEPKSKKG